jgi:hypothetical protein
MRGSGVAGVTTREVELDGELTIEVRADDGVRLKLRWRGIPSPGELPGWTPVRPADGQRAGCDWPWDGRAERELASFMDALHDHRARRTERSEMRVHFWERRARDASAVAAAAWARELVG